MAYMTVFGIRPILTGTYRTEHTHVQFALDFEQKVLKMSLTPIKKYSERGQILKDPTGRLPRKEGQSSSDRRILL